MNPFSDLTDMEIYSLGYSDRDEFEATVEAARQTLGDKVYSYEPRFLKKSILSAYSQPSEPLVQTEVKPVASQEQTRLTSPRKPDTSKSDLYAAAQAAAEREQQKALQEGAAATELEQQATIDYLSRQLSTPRAHDASPTWSPLAKLAEFMGAPAKIVEALKPQQVMSAQEVASIDKAIAERKSAGAFDLQNYYREHHTELDVDEETFMQLAREWTNDFYNWSPDSDDFYSAPKIAKAVVNKATTGDFFDEDLTDEYHDYYESGGNAKYADPRKGLTAAITRDVGGALYETPLYATLRGFVAPEALVGATAGTMLGDDRDFVDSLSDRIAKGEGLEKTGSEVARYFGAEPGSPADDIGWFAGLTVGFIMPADLGATDLVKPVLKETGHLLAKGAGVIVDEAGETSAMKKLLGLSGATIDELKKADPTLVDIRQVAIRNADLIEEPHSVAKVISLVEPDEIAKRTTMEDVGAYVKAKIAKAFGTDEAATEAIWNDFLVKSKALGLNDLTGPAKEGRRLQTILPIGDTGLAWERYLNQVKKTASATYGSEDAVSVRKAIASTIVKRRVDEAVASGILPGREMTMLTPTTAIPTKDVPVFLSELHKKPVMVALSKAMDDLHSGRPIDIRSLDSLQAIPRSVFERTAVYDFVDALKKGDIPLDPKLTPESLNKVIDHVVGYFVQKSPMGQTITELSTIAKRTDQVLRDTKAPLSSKLQAAITKLNLETTFTPTSLRPTGFLASWKAFVSPILVAYAPNVVQRHIMSPLESFTRTNLVTRLGALGDVYKADYDRFLAQFKNHDEALAATIFSQSTYRGADTAREIIDYESFWCNFMAALYGGYDSVTEIQVLRSGTKLEHLTQKQELITVFTEAYSNPAYSDTIIGQLARAFKEAVEVDKDKVKGLKVLGVTARILDGRPLSDFTRVARETSSALSGIELSSTIRGKQPLFAGSLHIPLYATYVQAYQLNAVKDIRNQIMSSASVLSLDNVLDTLKEVSKSTAESVVDEASALLTHARQQSFLELTKLFPPNEEMASKINLHDPSEPEPIPVKPKLVKPLEEAVTNFIYADYVYATSLRVAVSNPDHVGVFAESVKKILEAQKLEPINGTVDEFVAKLIAPLGYSYNQKTTSWYRSVNVQPKGEGIYNFLTGMTNVALTEQELRAWSDSLYQQAQGLTKEDDYLVYKNTQSAYSVLNDSGLYDLSEISDVISNSVPLKDTERAFLAFDYLRDTTYLGSLPRETRSYVYNLLVDETTEFTERLQNALKIVRGPDITKSSELSMILQQGASTTPEFLTSTLPGFIKNNLLGGGFVPNPVYHFQNFISGPLLMYTTLNKRETVLSFLTDFNIFSNRTFKTPSGRVYTNGQLDELMTLGGVSSSTLSAEIKTNILRDMIDYGGKLVGPVETKRGFFKKLAKHIGFDGLSTFNQLAQHMDLAYRKKALVDGLLSGLSEEQALEVARKALFDYSDLTDFEREYVAKYLWFYRFMRQNLVRTTVAFLDNPAKMVRLAKLSKFSATKMFNDHLNPDIQDYKDSRSFITLIDGQDKARLAIYSPSMPVLEATAQLMDSMSFFMVLWGAMGSISRSEKPDVLSITKTLENLIQRFNANPVLMASELGIQRTFGVQVKLSDTEDSVWLDPRFVAWAKATGQWNTLNSYLAIELVADDPRVGITTFDGYYYKVQPESMLAWKAMMETLKVVGLQRSMRDYSTLLQLMNVPGMSAGTDIQTTPSYDILRTLGILQVSSATPVEQAQSTLRKELINSMGGTK